MEVCGGEFGVEKAACWEVRWKEKIWTAKIAVCQVNTVVKSSVVVLKLELKSSRSDLKRLVSSVVEQVLMMEAGY